ncbi:type-F conjugative transfer system pilin assembly thiol-disulfide isomerase TrbB [Yersinia enterocolitica]|nr:type-F conjugative transfer system pilin assembly thiol-disulfide isomerase TrbB [Yersinia enterocolitica]EKN4770208.1 type-F conjugative transfer system pilin assembly thiol-disulfide isomerase TrbB [Yersinia enterocolitica]ELI7924493.1 type-F conjugative transfer system pilin assembly thiol-disulfide isomerase TrbB [Yersinia enterocolitica]MBW5870379.1 type-F conjugative transfer system pilin assembly thiol-disulfide isomerase TrbB [Yersinia enterocolitica]HEI6739724.1 type-F conjugative t
MMFSLSKPAGFVLAVLVSGCLQAGTLDDIRALEAGKTGVTGAGMSRSPLPTVTTEKPVWYALSDGRHLDLREWTIVLFMQSTCHYCQQFDPLLKAFSQKTGLAVFAFSLDGKGDATYPNVLPATPDVMLEFFQGGLPVATPTLFLTNVNTMETYPLWQGVAEEPALRARLDEVLRLALDRQEGKTHSTTSQGAR